MTLDEFDARMDDIWRLEQAAEQSRRDAIRLEAETFRLAEIEHVERGPGFPGWTYKGGGWYNTPRKAMEAKLRGKQ